MSIRSAAIEVSHWHSLYDSAYLRHLACMPDVQLIGGTLSWYSKTTFCESSPRVVLRRCQPNPRTISLS